MKQYEEMKLKFHREELTILLCEKKYTYKKLSEIYHYNKRNFSKLAKEYNIPKQNNIIGEYRNEWHKINFNLNHVLHLYFNLNKSLREIAKIHSCTHRTVGKFLKNNGIEIRSGYSSIYYESRKKVYSKYKEVDSSGYIILVINGERIREHRYIIEQFLHRKLIEEEYVHHLDFNKTNNDVNNLFLFSSNNLHKLYHGYIENNPYISPTEYLDYYDKNLKNKYENPNWLYFQYINELKSCNAIAKELKLSRNTITNRLKDLGIYNLRNPTINQFR